MAIPTYRGHGIGGILIPQRHFCLCYGKVIFHPPSNWGRASFATMVTAPSRQQQQLICAQGSVGLEATSYTAVLPTAQGHGVSQSKCIWITLVSAIVLLAPRCDKPERRFVAIKCQFFSLGTSGTDNQTWKSRISRAKIRLV